MTGLWRLALLTVPGVASAVPVARHCVEGVLTAAGYVDLDEVLLLVSELATNAVTHSDSGSPGGTLTIEVNESCAVWADVLGAVVVRVDVIDDGSLSVPTPRTPDSESGGGRGLWLVENLADKWGHWERDKQRGVWFELELRTNDVQRSTAGWSQQ
ncbi:ATP-binding protein [Nonomuraea sediminis]|uniref:ATP-binding protein n=1 Tax=Nonomuraea sediminis TaxID=2835864 RepID=UPI001BDD82FB|nr:ATP-binding protein [Nonomuraea sediminis]